MSGKFNKGTFDLLERGLPTNWQAMPNSTLSAWLKANPDIARADYHLFGNDKLALTRNNENISVVQNVLEKKCLLWTKMEDLASLTYPEIGPTPTFGGGAITYSATKFGNGSYHDATTEWIRYPDIIPQAAGCIEAWLKPNFSYTDGATHHIMGGIQPTPDPYFQLAFVAGTDTWDWYWGTVISVPTTHAAGDLFHMAIVWNWAGIEGTVDTKRMYIDGVLRASNSATESVPSDRTLHVGTRQNPQEPFTGNIDNLKVWNYAKTDFSDREIESAANFIEGDNGIVIPSDNEYHHMGCRINHDQSFDLFLDGQKVHSSAMKIPDECFEDLEEKFWPDHWWKLNEGSGTSVYDSGKRPVAAGTMYNTPTLGVPGKQGNCMTFTFASAEKIEFADHDDWDLDNNFTIAGWFKTPGGASYPTIIGSNSGTGTTWADIKWVVMLQAGTNQLMFQMSNNGGSGLSLYSVTAIDDDNWHHFVVVRDGSSWIFVIDGAVEDTASWGGTCLSNAWLLRIAWGYGPAPNEFWDGEIDDIRLYLSKSFTAQEARQLYEYTNNYYLPQPRISIGETVGGRISKPKHWWKLNERSGTTTFDLVGGIDGNIVGTAEPGKLGVFGGRCCTFPDASSSRIDINGINSALGTGVQFISVSAWINTNDAATANDGIVGLGKSAGTDHGELDLIVISNTLSFRINDTAGTAICPYTYSNSWHHVIAAYDYVYMYLYLDGQLCAKVSYASQVMDFGSFALSYIGCYFGDTWCWNGEIQDVKIYDFAVTSAEARQLYNLGRTPNGEVCDIRYDRVALSDDEIRLLAESNRSTDPDQDAKERYIRL